MSQPFLATPTEIDRLKPLIYHPVTPELGELMEAMRCEFLQCALAILRNTKPGRPQSIALTHLEEACQRTMQAIALEGVMQLPRRLEVCETVQAVPHAS